MTPKVGIVVPSYNQGKYLEKALKSIVENMKYADIALVVMDGGSSDDSVEIIRKYEQYIRFWKSAKDEGQASAVNEGMKLLDDCKYVMWLNSDDEYNDEKSVMEIVEFAEQTGYKVCYGKSYFIDESGNKTGTYGTIPYEEKQLRRECFLSQPSVLVLKSAWDEENGLDGRLQMCMDYELWIRLSKRYQFGYLESYVGNTRMYGETKTSQMKLVHLCEAICILDKQYGKVPLNWIYELWRYGKDDRPAGFCSVKLALGYLFFRRKKYIETARARCRYYR